MIESLIHFLSHLFTVPLFGNIFAVLVILIFCSILYKIHKSEKNNINFADLFLDKRTGKIGGSEFRINTAFLASTWALVFLTIKGALTEWFFAGYLAAFVADRIFSRTNDGKKNNVNKETTNTDEVK